LITTLLAALFAGHCFARFCHNILLH
jgi:hypothetical protein